MISGYKKGCGFLQKGCRDFIAHEEFCYKKTEQTESSEVNNYDLSCTNSRGGIGLCENIIDCQHKVLMKICEEVDGQYQACFETNLKDHQSNMPNCYSFHCKNQDQELYLIISDNSYKCYDYGIL